MKDIQVMIFIIFTVLSAKINAQVPPLPKNDYELLNEVYTDFHNYIITFGTSNEKAMLNKTNIRYSNFPFDDAMPSTEKIKDSFLITVPLKLVVSIKNDVTFRFILNTPNMKPLWPLTELWRHYRNIIDLNILNPSADFLGLSDIDIEELQRTYKPDENIYLMYVESEILFILLHEFGHVIFQSIPLSEKFVPSELEEDMYCDEWALKMILKFYRSNNFPIGNDIFLSGIRAAFELFLFNTQMQSYYFAKKSPRIERNLNFLRIARDSICGIEKGSKLVCQEISKQINLLKAEGASLLSSSLYMSNYADREYDDTLFRCMKLVSDSILQGFQKNFSATCNLAFNNFLQQAQKNDTFVIKLNYIAEAYYYGTWGVQKDISKAIALYELLSNLDSTSSLYIYSYMKSQLSREPNFFEIERERFATTAAILNEYHNKNFRKAIFYYKIASKISKAIPEKFYIDKIDGAQLKERSKFHKSQ